MSAALDLTPEQLEAIASRVAEQLERRRVERAAAPKSKRPPPSERDRAEARRIARRMGLVVRER